MKFPIHQNVGFRGGGEANTLSAFLADTDTNNTPNQTGAPSKSSETAASADDSSSRTGLWLLSHFQTCEEKIEENLSSVPRYSLRQIKMESLLGKGSFSKVFKVQLDSSGNNEDKSTSFMRRRSSSSEGGNNQHPYKRYALKCLNAKRMTSMGALVMATTDLVYESCILAQLDHENIIRLEGVASEGFYNSYVNGKGGGFYILLEMLKETLDTRLQRWRTKYRSKRNVNADVTTAGDESINGSMLIKTKSLTPRSSLSSSTSTREIMAYVEFENRVPGVSMGVASALRYLHSKGIILRDLKPENIGFTDKGVVKLFDFSLARRLEDCQEGEIAGSFRYLSPECMHGEKSDISSDVYSFGVLLYEVVTLERPYSEIITKSAAGKDSTPASAGDVRSELKRNLSLKVDGGGEWRHCVDDISCAKLRTLIQECWDPQPRRRPKLEQVCAVLEEVCDSLEERSSTSFNGMHQEDAKRRGEEKQQRNKSTSPVTRRRPFSRSLSDTGITWRRSLAPAPFLQRLASGKPRESLVGKSSGLRRGDSIGSIIE
jgi:serine/threonine protein kinase